MIDEISSGLGKRGLTVVEVTSLEDVPAALVMARTAAGLTQSELADKLGLKEQQIKRYEATGYASNVVVLRQTSNLNGRWIADLFSRGETLKHSSQHPELAILH